MRGVYYVEKEARSRQRLMFFDFATKRTRLVETFTRAIRWRAPGISVERR